MSEDCARPLWRPGQHRTRAGSTAASLNKTSGNLSVKGLCIKKHLVWRAAFHLYHMEEVDGLNPKGLLGLFFLFCCLTSGSYFLFEILQKDER